MSDTEITCQDCRTPFVFSENDQAFYEEKGFTPPKRCKPCRQQRKAQQDDGSYQQRPQRNENRSGGSGGSGNRSGGRDRSDRPMFDATCGDCGSKCQVPFQPKADRPVYCRECFSAQRR